MSGSELEKGVVYIPLPAELKLILASADDNYFKLLMALFGPIDKLSTTVVRFAGAGHDMLFNSGSPGPVINFMSSNDPASLSVRIIFYVAVGVAASFNLFLEYLEQKDLRKNRKDALQDIHKMLKKGRAEDKEGPEDSKPNAQQLVENIEIFNQALEAILEEDQAFKEKYAAFKVDYPDNAKELSSEELLAKIQLKFITKNSPQAKNQQAVKVNESKEQKQTKDFAAEKELENQIFLESNAQKLKKKLWDRWMVQLFWEGFLVKMLWNKILKPVWNGGIITAVTFWCMWILVAATTGVHGEGIIGLPNWLAFGLPAVVALPYVGLRFYNWCRHGTGSWKDFDENARLRKTAEDDLVPILSKTLNHMEYQLDMSRLYAVNLRLDRELAKYKIKVSDEKAAGNLRITHRPKPQIKGLNACYEKPYVKAGATFIIDGVSSYGLAHYLAWFTKDSLSLGLSVVFAASLATPLGWTLVGVGAAFAIVGMVRRYKESKKAKLEAGQHPNAITLEEAEKLYISKLDYLEHLKRQLSYKNNQFDEVTLPTCLVDKPVVVPKTRWEKCKTAVMYVGKKIRNHPLIAPWDAAMTGSFFGRVIFWTAAVFLPCVTIGAALSNPVIFGVVVGCGAVFTLLDWYQSRQKKKEKRIKELPGKIEEVEKNIAAAEYTLQTVNKEKELLLRQQKETAEEFEVSNKGYGYIPDARIQDQAFFTQPTRQTLTFNSEKIDSYIVAKKKSNWVAPEVKDTGGSEFEQADIDMVDQQVSLERDVRVALTVR